METPWRPLACPVGRGLAEKLHLIAPIYWGKHWATIQRWQYVDAPEDAGLLYSERKARGADGRVRKRRRGSKATKAMASRQNGTAFVMALWRRVVKQKSIGVSVRSTRVHDDDGMGWWWWWWTRRDTKSTGGKKRPSWTSRRWMLDMSPCGNPSSCSRACDAHMRETGPPLGRGRGTAARHGQMRSEERV